MRSRWPSPRTRTTAATISTPAFRPVSSRVATRRNTPTQECTIGPRPPRRPRSGRARGRASAGSVRGRRRPMRGTPRRRRSRFRAAPQREARKAPPRRVPRRALRGRVACAIEIGTPRRINSRVQASAATGRSDPRRDRAAARCRGGTRSPCAPRRGGARRARSETARASHAPTVSGWNWLLHLRHRSTSPAFLVSFSTRNGALQLGHGTRRGLSHAANVHSG